MGFSLNFGTMPDSAPFHPRHFSRGTPSCSSARQLMPRTTLPRHRHIQTPYNISQMRHEIRFKVSRCFAGRRPIAER